MDKNSAIVVSAFLCTGKTTYCLNIHTGSIYDIDSSRFKNERFPLNYIEYIKKQIVKNDIIFVSTHTRVREELFNNKIKFILVYPDISLKGEYIHRMKYRGDSERQIKFVDENWDSWIENMNKDIYSDIKICLKSNQYISDIF